jgi:hypothetical protein
MKLLALCLVCALAISASGQVRAQQMRPGQWEVTTRTEMSGLPMQMPDRTVAICVTAQNQNKPPIGSDGSCTFSNYRTSGNSATWQMACSGAASMTGDGRIDFAGDTYVGGSVMNVVVGPGQSMQMRMNYSGRRVGDC